MADEDEDENSEEYPGLLLTDRDLFTEIWMELETAWEAFDEEEPLSEAVDFDQMLAGFERFLSNRGKPVEECSFSRSEMEFYIDYFDSDEELAAASEAQLALGRKFIEELCMEGNESALHIKGYACYGGNRLYACDWPASRDCMIRLFEKTDDPQYANTLGYIYYYGRCNGGIPEYEKAFHYFGIAAANGLYEGMYKLADMFRHGYGCKQSQRTARALYRMVYDDSIKHFLKGESANFADAALRMGNVYAKGISERVAPAVAYHYYIQADYAARLRAAESDFFGNSTVVINIQKALEEAREKLPADYFKDYMEYRYPHIFSELAEDNNRCLLKRTVGPKGEVQLTAKKSPQGRFPTPMISC